LLLLLLLLLLPLLFAAAVSRLHLRKLSADIRCCQVVPDGAWPNLPLAHPGRPGLRLRSKTRRPPPCTALAPPFSLLATSLLLHFPSSNTEQLSVLRRLFALRTPRLRLRTLTLLLPWSPACRALRYAALRTSFPSRPPFACRASTRQQHSFAFAAGARPSLDPYSTNRPRSLAHPPPHTFLDHVGAAVPSRGKPTASAPQLWLARHNDRRQLAGPSAAGLSTNELGAVADRVCSPQHRCISQCIQHLLQCRSGRVWRHAAPSAKEQNEAV
jgi:hypothetical protein